MNKKNVAFCFITVGLLLIPLVHLIMPWFISTEPAYVPAGGGSGSIMAATNVYQQIIPYVLVYLTAPVFLITGLILLWKHKKHKNKNNNI